MKKADHGPEQVPQEKWADTFGVLASFLKKSRTEDRVKDPSAIRDWVGLEEKIVHDYTDRGRGDSLDSSSLPRIASAHSHGSFETFSTQTSLHTSRGITAERGSFRLFFAWVVAVALAALCLQGSLAQRDLKGLLTELRTEHVRLGQSYAELQSAFKDQQDEVRRLEFELYDKAAELRRVSELSEGSRLDLEQRYRQELMRLTADYEIQLELLRKAVRSREALAEALRIRNAFPDPGLQKDTSDLSASVLSLTQGKVTLTQGRQGFFVIDLGSDRGARPGRKITISREGVAFATGRIDRAYPTSSAVVPYNMRTIDTIQEGDTVFFS